jgi:hypothetical protein
MLVVETNAAGLRSRLIQSQSAALRELRLKLPPSLDPRAESAVFSFRDAIAAATMIALKEGSTNIGRKIAKILDSESDADRA